MTTWDTYPPDYRAVEVDEIVSAVRAGECAAVIGLSGSGKSNLLGFLANRVKPAGLHFVLADCNRLTERSAGALFRLIRRSLGDNAPAQDELEALDALLGRRERERGGVVGLLLDRFDDLAPTATPAAQQTPSAPGGPSAPALSNNLRALRDAHKYRLSLVIAARRLPPAQTELAELFHAHTLWLGALSERDARWSVQQYAARKGLAWGDETVTALLRVTNGYPSFLRAACEALASGAPASEAHAAGAPPDATSLCEHPAVRARLDEFFADRPAPEELRRAGVAGLPLLVRARPLVVDTSLLTGKEHALLAYFRAHAGEVCEKDDLIRAVWPEDQVLGRGLRDDSLAQLVRRLREKIEPDPSSPRHIRTAAGRGYKFVE